MGEQAASFVGNIPEIYDRDLGPVLFADFAVDTAMVVAADAPLRVLETAAGTGIVTRRLYDLLPQAEILATDLNLPMLQWAAKKFKLTDRRVAFRPADATALPFADNMCEAIVCQFGVMFYPDKEKSYRETYRVLAPGGHYIFSVWDSHRHNPFGRMAHELAASFFPVDPPQFYNVPFGYHAIDPIKESLLAAGFSDLTIAVVKKEHKLTDAAARARGMILGNPIIDQIKARGGVDPDAMVAAAKAALEREFATKPIPLQAIVFDARKPG